MRDIIITALIVVLAVVLIVLLNGESTRIDDLRQTGTELEVEVKVYAAEKKALQNELQDLKNNTIEKEKGVTSLLFVFKDTDEGFFAEIVPKLQEKNIAATFCITKNDLPSVSGFTIQQIEDLINSGWQSAMYWDGSEPLDAWYLDTTRLMSEEGVAIPKVICLDRAYYNDSTVTSIMSLGFEHYVIFNAPTDDALPETDGTTEFINSYPWYTTASSGALETLNIPGDKFGFVFGVENEDYLYKTVPFDNMIVKALEKVEHGKLIVTTPEGATQQTQQNEIEYKAALEEYNSNIERIEGEIAAIDEKIDAVHAKYFKE